MKKESDAAIFFCCVVVAKKQIATPRFTRLAMTAAPSVRLAMTMQLWRNTEKKNPEKYRGFLESGEIVGNY